MTLTWIVEYFIEIFGGTEFVRVELTLSFDSCTWIKEHFIRYYFFFTAHIYLLKMSMLGGSKQKCTPFVIGCVFWTLLIYDLCFSMTTRRSPNGSWSWCSSGQRYTNATQRSSTPFSGYPKISMKQDEDAKPQPVAWEFPPSFFKNWLIRVDFVTQKPERKLNNKNNNRLIVPTELH